MGLDTQNVAINEAVFLLSELSPDDLDKLKLKYPTIADNLKVGIYAGDDVSNEHLFEKAHVMMVVLNEARRRSETAMISISASIKKARQRRLLSQAIVIIGSSSLLGAVALDGKQATVISAILTLLAALGNLFAEYHEKLLNPQAGSIYDAYRKLGEGAYKAQFLSGDIQLSLKYGRHNTEMKDLILQANELCEQLNGWLIELLNQLPAQLHDDQSEK